MSSKVCSAFPPLMLIPVLFSNEEVIPGKSLANFKTSFSANNAGSRSTLFKFRVIFPSLELKGPSDESVISTSFIRISLVFRYIFITVSLLILQGIVLS